MKLTAVAFAASVGACCASCTPVQTAPAPAPISVTLREVERPASARQRYGPSTITTISDSGKTKYTFEDSLVRVTIFPGQTEFAFVIENKTDYSIKIVWDDAAFVDLQGRSGRVMHAGVKYSEKNNPQPPTVIVRRGRVTDVASPTERVWYGSYSGWVTDPLIPVKERDIAVGKTIALQLPLQIQDVVNEYLFTFDISRGLPPPRATKTP